jgi:hypothetical protein
MVTMLGKLIGSTNKERVLVYLAARDKGYARQTARFFTVPVEDEAGEYLDPVDDIGWG